MIRKENDLMLNMLANPEFTVSDLKAVGLNVDNTSLEDEETYKKHPKILEIFTKEDGTLNTDALHLSYLAAATLYNDFANEAYNKSLIELTSYHRDNIFAPIELRRKGPDSQIIRVPNPFRHTSSMERLGEVKDGTLSIDEIAQSLKVLTNPIEVAKGEKPIYTDSPEESFFTDFSKTRVLAQWDEDGEHIDPITGQVVLHKKGDKKLNENGTFYYENLEGRDIYGRQVLNKLNTLTAESSPWNKYDFFDSDDIELKSITGTALKNLALVGSMFIPYVGPAVIATSLGIQGAKMLSVLGKMLTGSDSPTLSAIEGWCESVNPQKAKTEYALLNMWCWENFLDLIGDSVRLIREQRFIFTKIPALIKGKYGLTAEGQKELETLLTDRYKEQYNTLFKEFKNAKPRSLNEIITASKELHTIGALKAANDVETYMKEYTKLGEILSKTYMTGITVMDTYGEAKEQGASDLEASFLTLGYGAAEAALLNTGVGEWLFPELRYNKMHQKAIMEALVPIREETKTLAKKVAKSTTQAGIASAKREFAKNVFKKGALLARDLWSGARSTGQKTLSNAVANALGEGVEEVSEEVLADVSKGLFNAASWLRNDDTILNNNWWSKEKGWTWKQGFDDYAMNFLGGFFGGGIAGMSIDNIRAIQGLLNMTSQEATKEIIRMARNNELDKFIKAIDNTTISYKNLSNTWISEDAHYINKPGDEDDNLDLDAKKVIKNLVLIIKNILDSNGISMSETSFLKGQTDLLKDMKYSFLLNSKSANSYVDLYNQLSLKLVDLSEKVLQAELAMEGKEDSDHSKETEKNKKALSDAQKALLTAQLEMKDLLDGKHLLSFVQDALFEMSPAINDFFIKPTFLRYLEYHYKKPYKEVTPEEKAAVKEAYENWTKTDKPEDIHIAADLYMTAARDASETLKNLSHAYILFADNPILQSISDFLKVNIDDNANKIISQYPEQTDDIWRNTVALLIQSQPFDLSIELLKALDVDITNINLDIEKLNIVTNNNSLSLEDKETKKAALEKRINENIFSSLSNNISKIITPYINLGFINGEDKILVTKILERLDKYLLILISDLAYKADSYQNLGKLSEEDQQKVDSYKKQTQEYQNIRSEIQNGILQLNSLSSSPVEKNLQLFIKDVIGADFNISKVLEDTTSLLLTRLDSIDLFILGLNLDDKLRYIQQMTLLYHAVLLGASVDNGNYFNVFGLNKTINEIAKILHLLNYQDLAEIDQTIVNSFEQDIIKLENKISYLRKLNAINQGQKLNEQKRVGLNTTYLLAKRFNEILKFDFPEWKGKDKLEKALLKAVTINKYLNKEDRLNIKEDEYKAIEKEKLDIEDAIYDFFNSTENADLLSNLKSILKKFDTDLLEETNVILNSNTERLDSNSFIWWLATRAAVKASSFYKRFSNIISDNIAPIPTQELAVYTNYASIVNGNMFNRFVNAYKHTIQELWNENTEDFRKRITEKVGLPQNLTTESDILKFLNAPRWTNIILVEGIPGSGKTQAVFKETIELLKRYHEKDGILDKVYYIHGANKSSAEEAIDEKHLNLKNATALDIEGIFNIISGNNSVNDESFERNELGELVSSRKLIALTEDIPTIIFIDEVSNLSTFQLDTINKYAEEHGITVIAAGDFDQNGYSGEVNYNGRVLNVALNRLNFIRSPKLGVSMRVTSSQKAVNLSSILTAIQTQQWGIDLKYHIKNKELYGDRVFCLDYDEDIYNGYDYYDHLIDDSDLKSLIDDLFAVSEEPIGVIYHNDNSGLLEYLETNYKGKYIKYKDNEALGKEGKYFIIEASSSESQDADESRRDIYTGITRASLGSIIITDLPNTYIKSTAESTTIPYSFNAALIKEFSNKRKELLSSLTTEGDILYIKRATGSLPLLSENKEKKINLELVSPLQEALKNIPISKGDKVFINNKEAIVQDFELGNDRASVIVNYTSGNESGKIVYSEDTVKKEPSKILSNIEKLLIKDLAIAELGIAEGTRIIYNGKQCLFKEIKIDDEGKAFADLIYPDLERLVDFEVFKATEIKLIKESWISDDEHTKQLLNVSSITIVYNSIPYTFELEQIPFTNIKDQSGTNNIVNILHRNICCININGLHLPFYMSTGQGGKERVLKGLWYPIFGISDGGWLNKGTLDLINNFYDCELLKLISNELNKVLGTGFEDEIIGPMISENSYKDTEVGKFLNLSITPVENNTKSTIVDFLANVEKVKNFIRDNFDSIEQENDEFAETLDIELEEKVIQSSEDTTLQLLEKLEAVVVNQETNTKEKEADAPVDIDVMYYTFNTFNPGVIYNEETDYPIQTGVNEDRKLARIDMINGLMHIKHDNKVKTVEDYINLLYKIRSAINHATNVESLQKRVTEILKRNGFEISDLLSKFVIKISASPSEGEEFGSKDSSSDPKYFRYDHSKNEIVIDVLSHAPRAEEVRNKTITCLFGDAQGNLLEIPILSFSNPISILKSLSKTNKDLEKLDLLWEAICSRYKNQESAYYNSLQDFIKESPEHLKTKYRKLFDLIDIFLITNNSIWALDENFLPSKDLHNCGPNIIANDRLDYGEYTVSGFEHKVELLPISNAINNRKFRMSLILFSTTDVIYDIDGKPMKIKVTDKLGNTIETTKILEPGMPFILVTDDFSLPTSEYLNTFIELLKHPELSKKVTLVKVQPPKASVENYLDNLIHVYKKEPINVAIGNIATNFRLISLLLRDTLFVDQIRYKDNGKLKGATISELITMLNEGNILEPSKLKQWLNSIPSTNGTIEYTRTRKAIFQEFLTLLLFNLDKLHITPALEVNTFNKLLIINTLKLHNVDGIYVSVKRIPGANSVYSNVFAVQLNSDYTVRINGEDLPYTITGGLDTSIYKGSIDIILNAVHPNKRTINTAGMTYNNSDNNLSQKYKDGTLFALEKLNELNPDLQRLQELLTKIPTEIRDKISDNISYENLVKELNNAGYLVIQDKDAYYISDKNSELGKLYSILIIGNTTNSMIGQSVFVVEISSNGTNTLYNAVRESKKINLIRINKENANPINPITETNYKEIQELIRNLLNDDFKEFFADLIEDNISFDDFIINLSDNIDYLEDILTSVGTSELINILEGYKNYLDPNKNSNMCNTIEPIILKLK